MTARIIAIVAALSQSAPHAGRHETTSAPTTAPAIGLGTSSRDVAAEFIRFVAAHADFPEPARRFVAAEWSKRAKGDAAGSFVNEALAVLYPEFKRALDAASSGDAARAEELFGRLAESTDPYLAVNSAYFFAQARIAADRPIDADKSLRATMARVTDWPRRTPAGGEMCFLSGYCALQALRYDEATAMLDQFIRNYPAAPERMRRSAEQMLKELAGREPKRLGDVSDLMAYAHRELEHGRSDDDVRTHQREAVRLLDRLVDEAEKQEKNQQSSASANNNGRGKNDPRSAKPGGTPAPRSVLPPGGGGDVGDLKQRVRARPGESWGKMPAREREALLQTLQKQFPSQYRDLVEQYYRQLSKDDRQP